MPSTLPTLLAAAILLGLVHLLLAGALSTAARGAAWNVGNRDGEPPPLGPHAGRAQRAWHNFLETFPFFAAAVLGALILRRTGERAELGAQLYFWARVIYLPVYVIGIPVVRSLVWTVGLVGLLMVVSVLFG